MCKRAQVLIISLWILVLLTILTLGIAHRVSLALRISRYQKDSIKAFCLAKAGINRAISVIESDETPASDYLKDKWSDNEAVFREVRLGENTAEFATVSYSSGEPPETRFGVRDEERKININIDDKDLIITLLEECGIDSIKAQEVAGDILIYRGALALDADLERYYMDNFGYPCKGANLVAIEELSLVKGIKDLEKTQTEELKSLIRVSGPGKVNINTASLKALTILGKYSMKKVGEVDADLPGLITKIDDYRNGDSGPFDTAAEIDDFYNYLYDTNVKQYNIFGEMKNWLITDSNYFYIESTGHSEDIARKITVVYNSVEKIIFWHEE